MSGNGSGGRLSRRVVEKTVAEWQKRLGLERWDLKVDWTKSPGEEANATTWRSNTYDKAGMYFDPDFESWSLEFLNQIVVHELLHLVTRDIDRVIADAETQLHPEAYRGINLRYEHEIEGVVDRLAYRIVEIGGCVGGEAKRQSKKSPAESEVCWG